MKKILITVFTVTFFAFVFGAFAAEKESWIDKVKNRFKTKEKTAAVTSAKPAVPAPTAKKPEPAPAAKETPAKPRTPIKEMKKPELLKNINDILETEDEVLDYFPPVKKQKDSAGKNIYTYNGTLLENVDEETLRKILGTIRNISLKLRTDRITRQLEAINRAQRITNMPQGMPAAVRASAQPPSVPKTPQVPITPTGSSQPPRVPQTPATRR